MNFVPALCMSNVPEIIAEIEGALNKCKVSSMKADDIRTRVVGVLNKSVRTYEIHSPDSAKKST